jgi:hypothetical protein
MVQWEFRRRHLLDAVAHDSICEQRIASAADSAAETIRGSERESMHYAVALRVSLASHQCVPVFVPGWSVDL